MPLLLPLLISAALGQAPAPAPPDPALVERARKAARAAADALAGPAAVGIDPYARYRDAPAAAGLAAEEVRFTSQDGTPLVAWHVPPRRGGRPKGTLLVLHGWASNVGFGLSQAGYLADHGYALFLLDGRSGAYVSRPAEFRGFLREDLADVAAALAALRARPRVDPARIAIVGYSWGATKALLAGAEHPGVRAVVADAAALPRGLALQRFEERMPPASRKDPALVAVFLAELDARFVEKLGYPFSSHDVLAAAARIAPRPLLLLHGKDDTIVPVASTEAIARASHPTRVVLGDRFGHCQGMRLSPKEYVPAVVGFLDEALGE